MPKTISNSGYDENGNPIEIKTSVSTLPDNTQAGVVAVGAVGATGSNKSRRLSLATSYSSTTNTVEWIDGDKPSEVRLKFVPSAAASNNVKCLVTFDANTDAVEQGWLSQGSSKTATYPNVSLIAGEPSEPIYFDGLLSRLGALPDVAGDLYVEAV